MPKPLTIGLLCPYNFQIPGGVQEHTTNLGHALTQLGHHVVYFSPTPRSPHNPTPHTTIGTNLRVPTPNGSWAEISFPLHNTPQIQQIIKRYRIDLLHFQEILSPTASWQWFKVANLPKLITFHAGWESNHLINSKLTKLITFLKHSPYTSIAVSQIAKHSNSHLLSHPTHQIPPCINLSTATKHTPKPAGLLPQPHYHLTFLGRLDHRKGCLHLLQALPHLSPTLLQQIRVHIIGTGPQLAYAKQLTKNHNLTKQVSFHGTKLGQAKIAFLQHSNLCVFPTTHGESFGMVLIEALAAGTPVIAGNNVAYKETLRDYPYPQYLLDPTNHLNFAHQIESLLTNKSHQAAIKKWAKPFVKQFDPKKIAQQHLHLYRQILASSSPARSFDSRHHLAYYDLGDPSLPLLVLLHGHRSDSGRLLPLAQALSQHFHVLNPDLPGSGKSQALKDKHTIQAISQKISGWLNHYLSSHQLTTYSLVGLSLGGGVAIRSLKQLKHLPQTLYLYATPTSLKSIKPSRLQRPIVELLRRWERGEKLVSRLTSQFATHQRILAILYRLRYPLMPHSTAKYEASQWSTQQPRALVESIKDLILNPISSEPPSLVKTIYIHPFHDNLINLSQVKKELKPILPNTRYFRVNLASHVPKGPLQSSFFQPFIRAILKHKN